MRPTAPLLLTLLLLAGLSLAGPRATRAQNADPTAPGPLAVASDEYDLGDEALSFPGLPGPVEFAGSVHYPAALAGGPYPLIVLLHGRHATAAEGEFPSGSWPPQEGEQPIRSYRGYDYLAANLAGYGYVVVSISGNGINAADSDSEDTGASARAGLIQQHLDLWSRLAATGGVPFGTRFVGKVDLTRVGVMGHSRGGEGAVSHYLLNSRQPQPYGVRAVFALAPTDFLRRIPTRVPFAVLLPYCDGDVVDLQGVHFFDDARYRSAGDPAPKHSVVVLGANHNFFNTVWSPSSGVAGASDDWLEGDPEREDDPAFGTGPGTLRLDEEPERRIGLAYMAAFFRRYVGGETAFDGFLSGAASLPELGDRVLVSYHAPDQPGVRRDVSRTLDRNSLTRDWLGGRVWNQGLSLFDVAGGAVPQPRHVHPVDFPAEPQPDQPHTTPSYLASSMRGLAQLRIAWTAPGGLVRAEMPAGSRDVRQFQYVQLRAGLNFFDRRNLRGQAAEIRVGLVDGSGRSAEVPASRWSRALRYPLGKAWPLPKLLLHTVRIPLSAFQGVSLADVRTIRLRFTEQRKGAVVVSDLALAD